MKKITSSQNAAFRVWLDLKTGKGIRRHQQFLLSGRKLVPEAIRRFPKRIAALLTQPAHDLGPFPMNLPQYQLSQPLFAQLDDAGTDFPILVLSTGEPALADLSRPAAGLEVICALGDPANVGALTRSAIAFGAKRIILTKEAASPFHPKAVRASSGTLLYADFALGPSLDELAAQPEWQKDLVAFDRSGLSLKQFSWPRNCRLIFGEEGPGLPGPLRGARSISIPIRPEVESLNAVAAASIALFSYRLSFAN